MDDVPVEHEAAEETHEAAAAIKDATELSSMRQQVAELVTRLEALEQQLAAAELGELLEAIHELHAEDVAPKSSSWMYRSIGRRDD